MHFRLSSAGKSLGKCRQTRSWPCSGQQPRTGATHNSYVPPRHPKRHNVRSTLHKAPSRDLLSICPTCQAPARHRRPTSQRQTTPSWQKWEASLVGLVAKWRAQPKSRPDVIVEIRKTLEYVGMCNKLLLYSHTVLYIFMMP